MKLYTGSGDHGETSLLKGQKVSKASPDIEALGELDELNAAIGFCRAHDQIAKHEFLDLALQKVQHNLFELGAEIADANDATSRITHDDAHFVEKVIDRLAAMTPPIKFFILPSGCEGACRFHLTRAIARRAERALVGLAKQRHINAASLTMINRLSDLLFAAARFVNAFENVPEQPWRAKT